MDIKENSEQELISKTQRKKDMIALQKLGEKLTTFKPGQLDKLPLDEELRYAIDEFKRLPNSHGARKRQAQYIGRVMRDANHQAISEAVKSIQTSQSTTGDPDSKYEQWCTRVLLDGDMGIDLLLDKHADFERQKLRQFYLEYGKSNESRQLQVRKKLVTYLEEVLKD